MNIYVGNLHFNVSEDELRKAFEEYGEVASVKIIADKYSGRSKGFGFVEMLNDKEAKEAIDNLNGTEIKGRSVNVNQAREKENNSGGGERRSFRSRS
jgi:RNA recognition motif-containing protein